MSDRVAQLKISTFAGPDAYANLAAEEFCFRSSASDAVHLLLYQHAPAVVFGRNQNPWIECDVAYAREKGLTLARRISGGGTVYHDDGNLNYSFIMPREMYEPKRFLRIVTTCLSRLGVPATACDRSSVWLGEAKVSGTAFMLTGRRALLHGCILVDSNLKELRRILQAPKRAIATKAVDSVRSPVTCLTRARADITCQDIPPLLIEAAVEELRPESTKYVPPPTPDQPEIAEYLSKQKSAEWIWGRTTGFRHDIQTANGVLGLLVKRGVIADVVTECNPDDAACVKHSLLNCPYDGTALAQRALRHDNSPFLREIANLVRKEVPEVGWQ